METNGVAGHAISNVFIADPLIQLMKDVITEEEKHEILQTDLMPMLNLVLDVTTLFQYQRKEAQETLKIWLQLLLNSLTIARSILHRYDQPQRQRCLDCLVCNPGRLSKEIKDCKLLFDYLFQGLQREFSIFVGAHQIVHTEPIQAVMSAEESLSKDEAWLLFRRIAFKNESVPMDIQDYATSIAEECNGFPLAITLVAAAMVGKTRVDEWETSLSSIKNADLSLTDTLPPRFHPKLYQCLRWSYNALPNSDVKNCFLYCAMYGERQRIRVEELVRMCIGEGLVRSKQGSHLMDMAIGRSYVNLLVDRFFFQNASDENRPSSAWDSPWELLYSQKIRVDNVIRELAMYIGEKEESCVFEGGQRFTTIPEIHNEDCKRMSLRNIENLPSEFRCPKLVSLFSTSHAIKEVPSGFLVSLTSLKVLNLSYNNYGNNTIGSFPSSVGQLKQLEFLRLSSLEDLPEEICNLSSLQFLDLSDCQSLRSLPSKIGKLNTLKYLNLNNCRSLSVIPHEISHLTLLSTLDAENSSVELSTVEAESEAASIWSLKSLRNLTMLRMAIKVKVDVQGGLTSSGINVGIMGTWLEMRHLHLRLRLHLEFSDSDDERGDVLHEDMQKMGDVLDVLPEDMQKICKLQSFIMYNYEGLSLPHYCCKFQHLEYLELKDCSNLKELSPLERLPNLKYLKLVLLNLKELDIQCGFLMLEKLHLEELKRLESIAGPSNNGVWNESILPNLRVLTIMWCPSLKRLPNGLEKLVSLTTIYGAEYWWQELIWEDHNMKSHIESKFDIDFM